MKVLDYLNFLKKQIQVGSKQYPGKAQAMPGTWLGLSWSRRGLGLGSAWPWHCLGPARALPGHCLGLAWASALAMALFGPCLALGSPSPGPWLGLVCALFGPCPRIKVN